eukprot:m.221858 g.221858  ORF g.221858 m.221858 type:complete len:101 (-) comp15618_c2_seq3:320-622(-)
MCSTHKFKGVTLTRFMVRAPTLAQVQESLTTSRSAVEAIHTSLNRTAGPSPSPSPPILVAASSTAGVSTHSSTAAAMPEIGSSPCQLQSVPAAGICQNDH